MTVQPRFFLLIRMCAAVVIAAGLLTANSAGAAAQDAATAAKPETKKNVDPAGTWRWESDQQGQLVKHVLKLNYDPKANKVTGSYKGSENSHDVTSGKMDGNKLVLQMKMDVNGTAVTLDTEGTIDGDNMKAVTTWSAGGDSGELDWEAKRSLLASDVIGEWELEFETDNGPMTAMVTITGEGEKLKGEYSGFNGQFQTEAKDVQVKDGRLMFTIEADLQGNSLTADYIVVPRGDSLKGTIEYDYNGATGELEVAGQREKK